MAQTGRTGASLAASGRADFALYRDIPAEAVQILLPAVAQDEQHKSTLGAASKLVALGDAHLAAGRRLEAAAAATKALTLSRRDIDLVGAARVLIASGRRQQAAALASELSERLPTHSRAYGRLVEGWVAMDAGNTRDAVAALGEARKLADFWLTRFSLGVAYVQADAHAEALSELETCQRRRGEAMAVFLDDVPTTRYLPPLAYWLARAQEGLGQRPTAAANYRRFLDRRAPMSSDPLVADARRRLDALK
jgi:tetratricopeptide (TPR) repeat protein